jgi:hypothetical protein
MKCISGKIYGGSVVVRGESNEAYFVGRINLDSFSLVSINDGNRWKDEPLLHRQDNAFSPPYITLEDLEDYGRGKFHGFYESIEEYLNDKELKENTESEEVTVCEPHESVSESITADNVESESDYTVEFGFDFVEEVAKIISYELTKNEGMQAYFMIQHIARSIEKFVKEEINWGEFE